MNNVEEVVDDWELPFEFHLFAKHEEHAITYGDECVQQVRMLFVEHMTPLDMLQLGNGIHDATGHCVWKGAYIFLQVLRKLDSEFDCFRGKKVLELGCGPGLAGLAVSKLSSGEDDVAPPFVWFTDADPDALNLCRKNCALNQLDPKRHDVRALVWGAEDGDAPPVLADTVVATDVIYDINVIPLLLISAQRCCSPDGHFVLVHVPRACYTIERPKEDDESLEAHIITQAAKHGFELSRLWHADDFDNNKVCVDNDLVAHCSIQGETGAAVLVFKRL